MDRKVAEHTVKSVVERHEDVAQAGKDYLATNNEMHPNVNVYGKTRISHNAMVREDDHFVLQNGIALPIMSGFDGTGSMGDNVEIAFRAIPEFDGMLGGIRGRYNTQVASAVWQDVQDQRKYGHPVIQMSQFESDERIVEQMRFLIPSKDGGDSTEDYDLGLAYLWLGVQTDIYDFYGLKGYACIVADAVGRGSVTASKVQQYLGIEMMQRDRISTREICTELFAKWHVYFVQVGTNYRNDATDWWEEVLGPGRTVLVSDPSLLAEVQAGLIYVTENARPNLSGLSEFLHAGGQNRRISPYQIDDLWKWLQDVKPCFGAQTKLENYDAIPKPGDVFAHLRDPWPIGHPRERENPEFAGEKKAPGKGHKSSGEEKSEPEGTPRTKKKTDWSKF